MQDLEIIIPTKNREEFLLRKLLFYYKLRCNFSVYIVDSSKHSLSSSAQKIFKKAQEKYPIYYYKKPKFNEREAIGFLLRKCREKYCAFCGDDDFLIPSGLQKARDFLDSNQDYRVAHGQSCLLGVKYKNGFGSILYSGDYWKKPERPEASFQKRLSEFSKNYFVPLFSVHRTSEFLADWGENSRNPSRSFGELFPNFNTILRGKAKYLPTPYLLRQTHDDRNALPKKFFEVIYTDKWFEGVKFSLPYLVESLVDQGLQQKKAQLILMNAMNQYFTKWARSSLAFSGKRKSLGKILIPSKARKLLKCLLVQLRNTIGESLLFKGTKISCFEKTLINCIEKPVWKLFDELLVDKKAYQKK